jgi:hypothetical protein
MMIDLKSVDWKLYWKQVSRIFCDRICPHSTLEYTVDTADLSTGHLWSRRMVAQAEDAMKLTLTYFVEVSLC